MDTIKNDVLDGAEAIGQFLGIKTQRVYKLIRRGGFPAFRLNNKISARKSSLLAWIEAQEQNQNQQSEDDAA